MCFLKIIEKNIYYLRSLLLITIRTSQRHIYLIYDRFLKYSRCGVNYQSIKYSNHTKLYTDIQIFLLSKCKETNGFENVLTSFIRYSFNQFFDVKLQTDAQFFLLKYFNVNLHGFENVSWGIRICFQTVFRDFS